MEKKKAIMRKVLSCLVVIAILTSTVPGTVFAMDSSVSATEASSNDNFLEEAHTENNSAENAINTKNNIAIARKTDDYPGTEKGEVLFRGEASIYWFDFWGGINWEGYEVNINQILYDPNNYLQNTPSIWVIQPAWSYPRMDSVSSGTLVEVYGQYVVVEIDGSIYGEIHLCEPDEEYGTRDYFLRDITQSETYESTGTVTGVPKNPSRAGFYSLDLDDVDYGWNWYGEVYFSKTSNGPQVDNVAVGDTVEICGNRYYYNDGRAIIDLITSDHYLKKKDSEPTQFYIRPACQDASGKHLNDVSYEFVYYPTYKGTCDYNEYLKAPGFGTYKVKFTKGNLEATVTLESHSKPFAGTVVTLRKKEGSIYATSTPSGANMYLDGTYKGTSPITILNVPVGTHTVKYTKTGYKDCVKTVTVYANQQRNVHCSLEEEKFYVRPACRDVNGNHLEDVSYEFVDYPSYKGTCDYNEYLIAPGFGTYKVKFTKGDLEATVTLESHSKTFAGTVVTLRKKEGSIYAISTPSGAKVYLDGTYKGTAPITISNVPVGTHTIKYTKTGYKDCEKTVTVYADPQRNVHCDLEEKSTEKPDLVVKDISLHLENPKQGDTITFYVDIKNQGSGNTGGFYVCYYVDGSYYDRDYVSSLSTGSTTTTSFAWTAKSGSHS